ncbi:MAG TPA: MXAN_2562 family outer membrane beta-barrel protein [Polyangiaceae bacterium]|nr:MXAN_2562 family outer membrane beta-barrel protein [Polyangiaceae bacterium]
MIRKLGRRPCSCLGLGTCSALLAGAVLLTGTPAAAQDTTLGFARHKPYVESPQSVAFELRFGRYIPDVDDGLGEAPYNTIFGSKNRFYGGFEIDWQALRIPYLGTLGAGYGLGYTISSAKAISVTGDRSDEDTTLQILPMYLVAVLRADVVAKHTVIPVVPYAKLGLGYALWRTEDGGDTPRVDGVIGRGRSYGYHAALGGMFMLDWFDVADARTADANIGLNHSYVFAEWFVSKLDGFGSKDQLNVGTSTWTAGLAFEF